MWPKNNNNNIGVGTNEIDLVFVIAVDVFLVVVILVVNVAVVALIVVSVHIVFSCGHLQSHFVSNQFTVEVGVGLRCGWVGVVTISFPTTFIKRKCPIFITVLSMADIKVCETIK